MPAKMRRMSTATLGLPEAVQEYVLRFGVREPPILARLREETSLLPLAQMQIAPEQGALLAMLVELIGARKCLEVGTFTGYSSLAVALALPPDGRIVCCDSSEEWTAVARRYWREAGVEDKVTLRLGPAIKTLDDLLAHGDEGTFDFAFLDADKEPYPDYYERILRLLRQGGLLAIDNVFGAGRVADATEDDPQVRGVRALNERIAADERVTLAMVPIADGVTLVRTR